MFYVEERRVSTLEDFCQEVEDSLRPAAVVLFGPDCEAKGRVARELDEWLEPSLFRHGAPDTKQLVEFGQKDDGILLIVLDSAESYSHELRHELVKVMKKAGVKTIAGVFMEATHKTELPDAQARQTFRHFRNNPPTPEGLKKLLIVSDRSVPDR